MRLENPQLPTREYAASVAAANRTERIRSLLKAGLAAGLPAPLDAGLLRFTFQILQAMTQE